MTPYLYGGLCHERIIQDPFRRCTVRNAGGQLEIQADEGGGYPRRRLWGRGFDTPDHIKEAGIRAIREGQTKYTPTPGTIEARKAVAYRMKEDLGVDFDYDAIVISNGAKACLYATFFTLLDTGDEVIVPAPYWVSYTEQIRMVGGVPVIVPTTEAQHFKMTPAQLEAAITDKTKALVLNNPSNPTGMIYLGKS